MISISGALPIAASFAGVAAPAASIIAPQPLWTPIVRIALAIELIWLVGGLAVLWWLTRRSEVGRTNPQTPRKVPTREEPPMAA